MTRTTTQHIHQHTPYRKFDKDYYTAHNQHKPYRSIMTRTITQHITNTQTLQKYYDKDYYTAHNQLLL